MQDIDMEKKRKREMGRKHLIREEKGGTGKKRESTCKMQKQEGSWNGEQDGN